jgi:hypothetical protein
MSRLSGLSPWSVACSQPSSKGVAMLDLLFIGLSVGFFALAWLYARWCNQL